MLYVDANLPGVLGMGSMMANNRPQIDSIRFCNVQLRLPTYYLIYLPFPDNILHRITIEMPEIAEDQRRENPLPHFLQYLHTAVLLYLKSIQKKEGLGLSPGPVLLGS